MGYWVTLHEEVGGAVLPISPVMEVSLHREARGELGGLGGGPSWKSEQDSSGQPLGCLHGDRGRFLLETCLGLALPLLYSLLEYFSSQEKFQMHHGN